MMRVSICLLTSSLGLAFCLTASEATGQPARVEGVGLLPVPAPLAVAKAEGTIRETFKADYAKTKPAERLAFAVKLMNTAKETVDDPAAYYVLLREAGDMAAKAGEAAKAFEAATELTNKFRVKRGEIYSALAGPLAAASTTPNAILLTSRALQAAAEELAAGSDWDSAISLLKTAEAVSKKARTAQSNTIRKRIARLEEIRAESAKLEADLATLRTNPDDPTANATVGRFMCFTMQVWDQGVPMLAKGNDAKFKDAAAKDLKASDGTDADRLAAADAWYELAPQVEELFKPVIQSRSLYWYDQVATTLTGLNKIKAEKRIKELSPPPDKNEKALNWNEIRAAVAGKKLKRWDIVGGSAVKETFEQLPPAGILIGFKYTTQQNGQYPDFVQPIYLMERGEVLGKSYGGSHNRGERILVTKAKQGYAVGAIYTRGGGGFDAFKPIFMKITNKGGLDPTDSYEGAYVGGTGGSPATLGGDGNFIAGIHGKIRLSNTNIQALSPITLTTQTAAKP